MMLDGALPEDFDENMEDMMMQYMGGAPSDEFYY